MLIGNIIRIHYALFIHISNEIAAKMPLQPFIIGATFARARASS
jgi:hypothetical protein